MSEAGRDELRSAWHQQAQRHDWKLVQDEEQFLDSVTDAFHALKSDRSWSDRARLAVLHAYGLLVYRGLWHREDRAAHELWLTCYRLALKRGWPPQHAEEVAQETITRVLEGFDSIRLPQSMILWALTICRTIQKERVKRQAVELPEPQRDEGADREAEQADPADVALSVEQDLVLQELVALFREKLDNPLERTVLMRIALFEDHPREVARDLGLPLHRTRIAKHRALKRLREDEDAARRLRELLGDWDRRLDGSEGDEDHE